MPKALFAAMKSVLDKLKQWWRYKLVKFAVFATLFFFTLFLLRIPIARGVGNYLIAQDEQTITDAVLVLGGGSKDRAIEAAKLYHEGFSQLFICTGEHVPSVLEVLEMDLRECDLARLQLIKSGVPAALIDTMRVGTSTMEEANILLSYCKTNKLNSVTVLSSKFHLRRVKNVFKDLFEENGIAVVFHGAPSSRYNESNWWTSEQGLIMVNNEYMKLLYYWCKY